jgi:hypothetical protein
MPTQTKQDPVLTDLNAVREFLLSGRELPPAPKTGRRGQRNTPAVPVHQGIGRDRIRSAVKL